jgi:IS30 family transposase
MNYTHLTSKERYQIALGVQQGLSAAQIAARIGRHRSTLSRELNRGVVKNGEYRAEQSQQAAERRARRSAANHPVKPPALRKQTARLIRRDWSPEQARGYLLRFAQPAASVPTIYAWIRQARERGQSLHEHLRYARRKRPWGVRGGGGMPADRPSIRQRPAQVQLRQSPGDWEGDTFVGRQGSTHRGLCLVERHSRMLRLRHPRGGWSLSQKVACTTVAALRGLPTRSITFDNGSEFSRYPAIAKGLKCKIYFADTHSPWQRGTCENTIGLLRQYIPKGTSGAHLTDAQLRTIENKLNHRPRKSLGFKTPAEVLLHADPPVALRT